MVREGRRHDGVEAEAAPSAKASREAGEIVRITAHDTLADGIAVKRVGDLTFPIIQRYVDDLVVVGEEEIASLMERFEAACATHQGKRPKIMILHHTYVAKDAEDAMDAARLLSRYYCYFGAWFKNDRPVTQGHIAPLSDAEIAGNAMMAPEKLRRDLTFGTAREVIDRLKRIEDLGYDEFSFWIDSGMPTAMKKASLRRFIDEVMPAFS